MGGTWEKLTVGHLKMNLILYTISYVLTHQNQTNKTEFIVDFQIHKYGLNIQITERGVE